MTKNRSIFKLIMENFLQKNFKNKRVIVRVDFNVPLDDNYKVTDTTRIEFSKNTIQEIVKKGGICILLSHMGRPILKSQNIPFLISFIVEQILKIPVKFCEDCIRHGNQSVNSLKEGEVILMENVRFYPEETKGDINFARELSKLGDYFVNDAFGTIHRAHSSTIIANFSKGKIFRITFRERNKVY